jgi:ketosteroid isomerase-like protein
MREVRREDTRPPEQAFLGWREDWEWFKSYLEEFIDAGNDRAVVVCRSVGKGRRSGVEVEMVAGEVWGFREGKISSLFIYRDKSEALAAAGLAQQSRDGSGANS